MHADKSVVLVTAGRGGCTFVGGTQPDLTVGRLNAYNQASGQEST